MDSMQYKRTTWRLYVLRLIHSSTAISTLVSVLRFRRESTTLQRSRWIRAAFMHQHWTRYKQRFHL